MTTQHMFEELTRLVPEEQLSNVLSAFKYNPVFWKALDSEEWSDKLAEKWTFTDVAFNPATFALFVVDPDLLVNQYPACTLETSFLEKIMLKYESALATSDAITSIADACDLAMALTEKFKVNNDWTELFHEVLDNHKFDSPESVIRMWGAVFACLFGWVEEKNDILQALLMVKSPAFGFPVVKNLLFSTPLNQDERIALLKSALTQLPLEQQVSELQVLRSAGKSEYAQTIAKGLFERYLVGNLEDKTTFEIWRSSEKSLSASVYARELAALAQIACENEMSEKLLTHAEKTLTAELAGIKIQQVSLKEESGEGFKQKSIELAPDLFSDPDIKKEYRMASFTATTQDKNLLDELEASNPETDVLGNDLIALRALNWDPNKQIAKTIANGDWENAGELIDHLLPSAPDNVNLLTQKVQVARALGNEGQYQSALEDVVLFDRENLAMKRELAKVYAHQSNWEAAFAKFSNLVNELGSEDNEDLLGLAESAVEIGQPALAIQASEKVLQGSPEEGRALAVKGYAEYRAGQAEQAILDLAHAVEVSPEQADPWRLLAQVHHEKGEIAHSIETLRTAHAAVPADRQIMRVLAGELIEQGQASEAISVLNGSESKSDEDYETDLLKIKAMKKLNLPDLASTVEKSYKSFSHQPEVIHEYTELLLKKGEIEKARKLIEPLAFSAAAKSEWKLTYIDSVLGQDYRHILGLPKTDEQQKQKAGQLLTDLLNSDSENLYGNILAGEAFLREGQGEKAFNLFSNLLNHSEAQSSNWLERIQAGFAWAANLMGKMNYALAGIQSVLEINPGWAGARETLAEVSAASGEIEDAVVQANQVLESAADVAESVNWFADFLPSIGKADEAEKTILELSKVHAQKLPLLLKVAELKLNRNEIDGAEEILNSSKAMVMKSRIDSQLTLAAKLFDQIGEVDFAAECLKLRINCADSQPMNVSLDLAGYYRKQGKIELALSTLDQLEKKVGNPNWMKLIYAEVLHAGGESAKALHLMNQLDADNASLPKIDELSFVPSSWKTLLQEDNHSSVLAAVLAYETGDYAEALNHLGESSLEATQKVLKIESEYALGQGKESLAYLDADLNQSELFASAQVAAEVAETLLDADQPEKAAQFIEKAVEQYPNDTALALVESRLLGVKGQLVQAEDLLNRALQKLSDNDELNTVENALIARSLVKAAVATKRWEEAKVWSEKLLKSQPKSLITLKVALEVFLLAVEFVRVVANLGVNRHIRSDRKSVEEMQFNLQKLITEAESNQDATVAHLVVRAKMALDPSQSNIRALAMSTPQKGEVAAMMLALKETGQANTAVQLAKKQPAAADILFASGYCLQEVNPSQAGDALKQSLKLNPAQPWASVMLAKLAQQSGENYSAITEMDDALQLWPEEAEWHLMAAELWRTTGNQKEAVAHYQTAAELEPENDEILLSLGKAYLNNHESQKAIDVLLPVAKTEVNNFTVWETLAEAYYAEKDFANALEAASRASVVNEFSIAPRILSARIQLGNGEAKKALELAQKAAEIDGENADVQLLLAKSWLANNEKTQALQALEKAVHSKNASLEIMVEHAKLIKEINGAANARLLLESLVSKYPENTELLNLLAEAQFACGDKTGAEVSAQHSIKLDDLQPKMQRFLGNLEMESGHLDQAIHHYSQSIAQEPQEVEVYLDLSNALVQQRDYDEALRTLQKAMDLDPRDTRPMMAAVNLLRNAKDYSNAESLLRRAAEISPNDLNIRRQLGAVIALNMVHSSQEASSHL